MANLESRLETADVNHIGSHGNSGDGVGVSEVQRLELQNMNLQVCKLPAIWGFFWFFLCLQSFTSGNNR